MKNCHFANELVKATGSICPYWWQKSCPPGRLVCFKANAKRAGRNLFGTSQARSAEGTWGRFSLDVFLKGSSEECSPVLWGWDASELFPMVLVVFFVHPKLLLVGNKLGLILFVFGKYHGMLALF